MRSHNGVGVTMYQPPFTVFHSESAGDSQGEIGNLISPADLCPPVLDFENGCEVGGYVLRDQLAFRDFAIAEARRSEIERLYSAGPSSYCRAKRIRERHVVAL